MSVFPPHRKISPMPKYSSETMKFKNTADHVVKLESVGLAPVQPGAEVDIPLELCAPGRHANGSRAKSALECVAPQLKPVDPKDAEVWGAVPPPPAPVSKIVTVSVAHAPQEAPGVKALREALKKDK